MQQVNLQDGYELIIRSGRQLSQLIKDLDINALEKELPVYTHKIKQFFLAQDKKNLTAIDVENSERIRVMHNEIADLISQEKESIAKNLRQLHAGKEMKNIYP